MTKTELLRVEISQMASPQSTANQLSAIEDRLIKLDSLDKARNGMYRNKVKGWLSDDLRTSKVNYGDLTIGDRVVVIGEIDDGVPLAILKVVLIDDCKVHYMYAHELD